MLLLACYVYDDDPKSMLRTWTFLQSRCWKRTNVDYPMTPGDQMVVVAICFMLCTVYLNC